MISSSRWSGGKCGKPLKQHSENGGQQIWPELKNLLGAGLQLLRHHDHYGQVLHLGMELEKAKALGAQTVLEPRLGVHLHLQQHHWPICRTGLPRSRPERAIEAMAGRLQLRRLRRAYPIRHLLHQLSGMV